MAARRRKQDEEDESPEAKRAKREAFARQKAQGDRELAQARRKMFTHFQLWKICPDKRCARAQACAGDAARCMNERWHVVISPQTKAFLQKYFDCLRDGHTPQEAARMAKEQMDLHLAALARLDAAQDVRAPAPAGPPPAAPPRSPSPTPRIRFL